jgi:hypothetical protein
MSLVADSQSAPLEPNVLRALQLAAPDVSWNEALSATADVICDGKNQTIVVGQGNDAAWVGVVPTSGGKTRKPMIMSWPIRHGTQAALCAMPIRIDLEPLNCETENGALPGCKEVKHCQSFSLADDECDPINVYWDSARHLLTWWRN